MAKQNTNIRFTFTGAPSVGKNFLTESTTQYGAKAVRLNFGVKVGTNMEFCGLYGSIRDTIHTYNSDNQAMDVDWADRKDPDVIAKVARYRKFRTNVGTEDDEIKEFITEYDFIQYLADELRDYKQNIRVTGNMSIRYDNKGVLRRNFNIDGVWMRRDKDKKKLSIMVPLTYWKDCVDKSDLKETGKIYVNGYVPQYIDKENPCKYLPLTVVFNTNAFNMDDAKQKGQFECRNELIDTKAKTPETMMWDVRIVNGAQEVEFDESQLTKLQKKLIELGEKTLDDFRPRGQIFGDRISELRFNEPYAKEAYANGPVDTGYKISEFEDEIYVPTKDESIDDMEKNAAKPKAKVKDDLPFEVTETKAAADEEEYF